MYNVRGLPNVGNSCYFNTFLQIINPLLHQILISNSDQLKKDIDNANIHKDDIAMTHELIDATNEFFTAYFSDANFIEEYKKLYIIINHIRQFPLRSQQDTSEAIILILDLIKNNVETKSLITIEFNEVIECNKCGHHRICAVQENSLLISNTLQSTGNNAIPFKNFLGKMLSKCDFEPVESNEFKCKCVETQDKKSTHIKTVLTKLPKYLFINVGRYDNNRKKIKKFLDVAYNFKITTPVNLDDLLSKRNTDKIEHSYELIGIAVHHGNSLNGGHYVAYCKIGSQWHYCNDGYISTCDIKDKFMEISENCALLVYKAK